MRNPVYAGHALALRAIRINAGKVESDVHAPRSHARCILLSLVNQHSMSNKKARLRAGFLSTTEEQLNQPIRLISGFLRRVSHASIPKPVTSIA